MPLAIGSHARRIAIQAALEIDEPSLTVKIIGEPTTLEEAILLIPALVRLDNINQAAAILERFPDIESAIRDELKGKIEIKRAMKAK